MKCSSKLNQPVRTTDDLETSRVLYDDDLLSDIAMAMRRSIDDGQSSGDATSHQHALDECLVVAAGEDNEEAVKALVAAGCTPNHTTESERGLQQGAR